MCVCSSFVTPHFNIGDTLRALIGTDTDWYCFLRLEIQRHAHLNSTQVY